MSPVEWQSMEKCFCLHNSIIMAFPSTHSPPRSLILHDLLSPVASTIPSRMTTISNSSRACCSWEMSQKGLFLLISWQIISGDTRNSRSSPVSKPTLMSVWFRGMNSPSLVCLERMSFALIEASTMCELRKSPTRNIKHNLLSRMDITALLENMSVSARLFGWEIFTNMQPTMKALTMEPKMACTRSKMMPSGHFSVMKRYP